MTKTKLKKKGILSDTKTLLHLARWLGPWGDTEKQPGAIVSQKIIPPELDEEPPIELTVYQPRKGRIRGTYFLQHGLHFAGAKDRRFVRLAHIFADAGYVVFAPNNPDYLRVSVMSSSVDDAKRAFRYMLAHPVCEGPIHIFTISFGSLLGLVIAGDPELQKEVAHLIIFGGYVDFRVTVEFCLTGKVNGEQICEPDPLVLPVLFYQIHDDLPSDVLPQKLHLVQDAWFQYILDTWGHHDIKSDSRFHKYAFAVADKFFPEETCAKDEDLARCRRLFLIGCAVEPGAEELIMDSISKSEYAFMDAIPFAREVLCDVDIIHGQGDDIIPISQAGILEQTLPNTTRVNVWRTGLYEHSNPDASSLLQNIPSAIRELRTMLGMLKALGK